MNYKTPLGFRDILPEEARARELATRLVQDLFASYEYEPIETPTLENQELMRTAGYRSSSPFKFFDAQGNLLIMRPDVTMQVARMCGSRLGDTQTTLRFRTDRMKHKKKLDQRLGALVLLRRTKYSQAQI